MAQMSSQQKGGQRVFFVFFLVRGNTCPKMSLKEYLKTATGIVEVYPGYPRSLFMLPELLATWGNIVLFLLSVVLAYM